VGESSVPDPSDGKLTSDGTGNYCPNCGSAIADASRAKFCASCGFALRADSAPSPEPTRPQTPAQPLQVTLTGLPRLRPPERLSRAPGLGLIRDVFRPIASTILIWAVLALFLTLFVLNIGFDGFGLAGAFVAGLGYHFGVSTVAVIGSTPGAGIEWDFIPLSAALVWASVAYRLGRANRGQGPWRAFSAATRYGVGSAVAIFTVAAVASKATSDTVGTAFAGAFPDQFGPITSNFIDLFGSSLKLQGGPNVVGLIGFSVVLCVAFFVGSIRRPISSNRFTLIVSSAMGAAVVGIAWSLAIGAVIVGAALTVLFAAAPHNDLASVLFEWVLAPNALAIAIPSAAGGVATIANSPGSLEAATSSMYADGPMLVVLAVRALFIVVPGLAVGVAARRARSSDHISVALIAAVAGAVLSTALAFGSMPAVRGDLGTDVFIPVFAYVPGAAPFVLVLAFAFLAIAGALTIYPILAAISRRLAWVGVAYREGSIPLVVRRTPLFVRFAAIAVVLGASTALGVLAYISSPEFRYRAALTSELARHQPSDLANASQIAWKAGLDSLPADTDVTLTAWKFTAVLAPNGSPQSYVAAITIGLSQDGALVATQDLTLTFAPLDASAGLAVVDVTGQIDVTKVLKTDIDSIDAAQGYVDAANTTNAGFGTGTVVRLVPETAPDPSIPIPAPVVTKDPKMLVGQFTVRSPAVPANRTSYYYRTTSGQDVLLFSVVTSAPVAEHRVEGTLDRSAIEAAIRETISGFVSARSAGSVRDANAYLDNAKGLTRSGLAASFPNLTSDAGTIAIIGTVGNYHTTVDGAAIDLDADGKWRIDYGGQPLAILTASSGFSSREPLYDEGTIHLSTSPIATITSLIGTLTFDWTINSGDEFWFGGDTIEVSKIVVNGATVSGRVTEATLDYFGSDSGSFSVTIGVPSSGLKSVVVSFQLNSSGTRSATHSISFK
jgi:hypothetical protein